MRRRLAVLALAVVALARRDAVARGEGATAARLRAAYVDYTLFVTGQMEALSRDTFAREVPQVLLVHANETNADALPEALDRLARGYRLYRFRVARGLPLRLETEPDPPKWVLDLYGEATRRR